MGYDEIQITLQTTKRTKDFSYFKAFYQMTGSIQGNIQTELKLSVNNFIDWQINI